jgi:predicted ester cyclase
MSGTHEGELFGIPGSGKPIAWRQCHLITVADGRATVHRAIRDDLGLMRQMGALPGG